MFASKSKTLVIMLLILSTALLGCAKQNTAQNSGGEAVQKEKTITVSWPRDIGPMNPHVYNPSQLIAQSMIYEPLVSYKEGGKLEPHLAESWNISEDGKEYTFKLR